jgi:signal transduction histidine kinase
MPADRPSLGPDTAVRNYPALLRRYANLLELSRRLTSTIHLDEMYPQVVEGAITLLECESAILLLLDSSTGELNIEAVTGAEDALFRHHVLSSGNSIAERVLVAGVPQCVDLQGLQDGAPPAEVSAFSSLHPRVILAVPMISKGNRVGVVEAINKNQGMFSPDDFSTLEALAGQAAVTIENLRLFRQSDLIAELVHEIRTPLAALNTAASLLDRQDLNEAQRHSVLSTFRHEIIRLNDLADDYLDLARLESGRVHLQPERFSVTSIISECAEIISPLVHAQGLRFQLEVPRDSLDLMADRAKLKQVILNLLTNAVKYNNPEGEVGMRAKRVASATPGEGDLVCIEISDTGRGIPEENIPHLFERFYRVPESTSLVRGTGLGLYIARHIVESHHGRIEVESHQGFGSSFRIYLPALSHVRTTGPLSGINN